MASDSLLLLLFIVALLSAPSLYALAHDKNDEGEEIEKGIGHRVLLSFKETRGTNATFECSPSGPCVPCLYSEKNDEKYRCSETGYRIPLKCVEIKDGSKDGSEKTSQKGRSTMEISPNTAKLHAVLHYLEGPYTSIKHRRLLTDSSTQENGKQTYITYRSCIPADNEEKLSLLGFEGIIVFLLLISGSVVYYKRKRAAAPSGFGTGRIQTYSRI
ncbi:hypothetical protein FNV43_RR26090 [Rhamnella rubrinervis]|uniref:Uncharacterized protein n=1 Tax=Rhamnella rubrinervis TaxID=2594499 RepID=A0A8K0DNM2_9ROSA|nr:hypothetical protein FNV43_RR26090 [Rhamnella rubrinervis]